MKKTNYILAEKIMAYYSTRGSPLKSDYILQCLDEHRTNSWPRSTLNDADSYDAFGFVEKQTKEKASKALRVCVCPEGL